MKRILILLAVAMLGACKPQQIVTEHTRTDSVIIREVPKLVTVPAQRGESPRLNLDSLVKIVREGAQIATVNRIIYQTDPNAEMRIKLLLDELGNLFCQCETQDTQIELMEREIQRLRYESRTVVEKPSKWEDIKRVIGIVSIMIFALLVIGIARVLRMR